MLIGREAEVGAIEAFLRTSGPRGLLLEGEPGIGKTSVWAAGVDAARSSGMTVLAARAAGVEVRLAFTGLADLLGRLPGSAFSSLPSPQRRAVDVALLRADRSGDSTDARAVGQALLGVLTRAAADAPVVVAIDDLQWLDSASGRALGFALRRLVDEPVGLLATARNGIHEPPPMELATVFPDDRLHRLRISPLSQDTIEQLLRDRLDLNLSRRALHRLYERAGGNPFFALEIGRLLEGKRIEAANEMALPDSLRDIVLERIAQLPERTRRLLLAAAALSDPRLELLGPTARSDIQPAVAEGIVTIDRDAVVFDHPLFAFVPYQTASPALRRRLHARLARVVPGDEERARHLALGTKGPDERVASQLDRAARLALARGAPDTAAELAHLARLLTPESDLERVLAEAEYTFESGDSAHARALMEQAVMRLEPGPRRAHALARLAWFCGGWGDDPNRALRLLDGAVEQAGADLAVTAEVFECLTWQSLLVGEYGDAARYARRGAAAADELGDAHWITLLALAVALTEGKAGRASAARKAITRLEGIRETAPPVRVINDAGWLRAIFSASDGDLDSALGLIRPLHQRALEIGDESSLPNLLEHAALLEFRAGDWPRADRLIDTALQCAVRTDQAIQRLALCAWRSFLDVHLGRIEPARTTAEETLEEARRRGLPIYEDVARWALVRLALSHEDPNSARAHFEQLRHPERGIGEHSFFRHYGDAAEALIAVRQPAAASTMVRRWRSHAAALDRATAGPGGDRCTGLIAVAEGDAGRGLRLLERAVARGRRLPEPFELGRSLLALGTAQRQSRKKREAARALREALETFEGLPAPLWATRARRELARIGGRPIADGHLTETERRIVALVAAGHTNAEAAHELALSPKTIEWNLSKAYRKLGVRSRSELAARRDHIEGFPRLVAPGP